MQNLTSHDVLKLGPSFLRPSFSAPTKPVAGQSVEGRVWGVRIFGSAELVRGPEPLILWHWLEMICWCCYASKKHEKAVPTWLRSRWSQADGVIAIYLTISQWGAARVNDFAKTTATPAWLTHRRALELGVDSRLESRLQFSPTTLVAWRTGVAWTKLPCGGPGLLTWMGDRLCRAGMSSRYVTIHRSTQPCIPPVSLNRVPALAGVKAGMSPLPGGR